MLRRALVTCVTGSRQIGLGQLTDLFAKLEHEPVVCAVDPVTLGLEHRDGIHQGLQICNIHASKHGSYRRVLRPLVESRQSRRCNYGHKKVEQLDAVKPGTGKEADTAYSHRS